MVIFISVTSYKQLRVLQICLLLALAEGMWAFFFLFQAPSEAHAVVFIRYSLPRLILLLVVLVLLLTILFLFVSSLNGNWHKQSGGKFVDDLWSRARTFQVLLILGGLTYLLLFASDQILGQIASYRERLYPMLVWFGLVSFQFTAAFLFLRGLGSGVRQTYRESLRDSLISFFLLAFLIVLILRTKIGLTPDAIYWQGPGAPLLISQVVLAWIIGLLLNALVVRFGGTRQNRVDAVICIALWALAVLLWWSQPARVSYNVLDPLPPNFQAYPFGDALIFDTTAHDYLAGKPIPSDFWYKPLYTAFLALLHSFSGENYELLTFLQLTFLACIPIFVYFIGCLIGNRTVGIVAALLLIVRERNGIALSNVIQVSHLKLLMSDVFSLALVGLLVWVLLRWLENPSRRRNMPLLLGGALGFLALTRGHAILLFPIILFILVAVKLIRRDVAWRDVSLFLFGITLTLLPWFLRNYETLGKFTLQDPVSTYTAQMAGIYSQDPSLQLQAESLTRLSSETDIAYYDQLRQQTIQFILQHPDEVLRFVSAHFFHNAIYSYIYLPQSFRIESLRAYVASEPFWGNWQGELTFQGWILLFINMGLIALGFGTAWKKNKYLALAPLLIGMGYNASVSVGRISGWRFILPADWITLVYFSIGLVQFSYIVWFVVTRSIQDVSTRNESQTVEKTSTSWMNATTIAVFLILIGSAVTYGNRLFSNRYPPQSAKQLMSEYLVAAESLGQSFTKDELERFLQDNKAIIVYGQAIYPYYLKSDSGPINHAWPAYKPRPYNRVVFYLVGAESSNVILPLPSHDFDFPDGADVIVIGCANDNGDVEALSILLTGESPSLFTREPMPALVCPFPE